MMRDSAVRELVPLVTLEPIQTQAPHAAHLDVYLADGERLHADTEIVRGHFENPMTWEDLRGKFEGLVEPVLGKHKTAELYEVARGFGEPGSLKRMMEILAPR